MKAIEIYGTVTTMTITTMTTTKGKTTKRTRIKERTKGARHTSDETTNEKENRKRALNHNAGRKTEERKK